MEIIIIALIFTVIYMFFSRSGDTKLLGKLDPELVKLRQTLLKTTDDRVHQQFVMLYAAIT